MHRISALGVHQVGNHCFNRLEYRLVQSDSVTSSRNFLQLYDFFRNHSTFVASGHVLSNVPCCRIPPDLKFQSLEIDEVPGETRKTSWLQLKWQRWLPRREMSSN